MKFFFGTHTASNFKQSTDDAETRAEVIQNAKNGATDLMPDNFFYSVLSYSGRYMFDQKTQKFVLFPKEDIAVKNSNGAWNLTLPNGTNVTFGNGATSSQQVNGNYSNYATSAWFIKTVKNVYNDSINYSYQNKNYVANRIADQSFRMSILLQSGADNMPNSIYKFANTGTGNEVTANQYLYTDSQLSEIAFPEGKVSFQSIAREDVNTDAQGALKKCSNFRCTVMEVGIGRGLL